MRYRDARLLKEGDTVIAKENELTYHVQTIEVYGNVKTVRINCKEKVSWLHTELKNYED